MSKVERITSIQITQHDDVASLVVVLEVDDVVAAHSIVSVILADVKRRNSWVCKDREGAEGTHVVQEVPTPPAPVAAPAVAAEEPKTPAVAWELLPAAETVEPSTQVVATAGIPAVAPKRRGRPPKSAASPTAELEVVSSLRNVAADDPLLSDDEDEEAAEPVKVEPPAKALASVPPPPPVAPAKPGWDLNSQGADDDAPAPEPAKPSATVKLPSGALPAGLADKVLAAVPAPKSATDYFRFLVNEGFTQEQIVEIARQLAQDSRILLLSKISNMQQRVAQHYAMFVD